MADNKVIIVDETSDEERELTPEELEELQRNERLKNIFKTPKRRNTSKLYYLSKVVNIVGLLGIMIAMLLESGGVFAIFFVLILISCIVNYVFLKK